MNIAGVLLAGGLSRRFGSQKAFAKLDGRSFYEYAVQALTPYCDEIIIVTRPQFVHLFPKTYTVIVDDSRFAGDGPLAGIYSAMTAHQADYYMVLPCDMPYIHADFMKKLLIDPHADVVSVKTDDHHHPLVSLWKRSAKNRLEEILIKKELRVLPLLNSLKTTWVHCDELPALKNINRPGDLK